MKSEKEKAVEVVENRNRAYRSVFTSDKGKIVYDDLEVFCGQTASEVRATATGMIDPYDVVYREGMRRVFLRIVSLMKEGEK